MRDDRSDDGGLSLGQATEAGRKPDNQDFHGALLAEGRARALKGVALALADGISTSRVSRAAAEACVRALMSDYYATPESWSVKTSVERVLRATNSWLAAQSAHAGAHDPDHGYVCTLAALILKGRQAHLFHVGDSRIWRLSGATLEPLTEDHRVSGLLTRAMGAAPQVEIAYRALPVAEGDVFLLTSDGVHDHWEPRAVAALIAAAGDDLDAVAGRVIAEALAAGSADNLTVQILRMDRLPPEAEMSFEEAALPVPDLPRIGAEIDGYRILRELHGNHRSHLYLAEAPGGARVALKIPGPEIRDDPAARRRFVMEEWIARRLDHPHLMGAPASAGPRRALYVVLDYIEGQSLRQWMHDRPEAHFEEIREILDQVISGLRALHRREMLHQDLRPENIMIDRDGRVRLIDFGSAYVAGVQEAGPAGAEEGILGTHQYTAPEYFLDQPVSWRSDLFSLGVIAYEMLTGELPYGAGVGRLRAPRDLARLSYRRAERAGRMLPGWLDDALARGVALDPARRPAALSDFAASLRAPSVSYVKRNARPLIERDPARFWKGVALGLGLLCLVLARLALR